MYYFRKKVKKKVIEFTNKLKNLDKQFYNGTNSHHIFRYII